MSDDELSRRQLAKRARRIAGDYSSDVARQLMQMKDATFAKLDLDDALRDSIARARAIPSQSARRRAERTLAGDLRRYDIDDITNQLAAIEATGVADNAPFHLAEKWRDRILADDAALAEFPGTLDPQLIAKARGERDTGKPPGAKRALFRAIVAALK